jgi:hypothetical protein
LLKRNPIASLVKYFLLKLKKSKKPKLFLLRKKLNTIKNLFNNNKIKRLGIVRSKKLKKKRKGINIYSSLIKKGKMVSYRSNKDRLKPSSKTKGISAFKSNYVKSFNKKL